MLFEIERIASRGGSDDVDGLPPQGGKDDIGFSLALLYPLQKCVHFVEYNNDIRSTIVHIPLKRQNQSAGQHTRLHRV